MITGNAAATKRKYEWGFHASAKAAHRVLAGSIVGKVRLKGIHVAYFIIDAVIDNQRTRPVMFPEKPNYFYKISSDCS